MSIQDHLHSFEQRFEQLRQASAQENEEIHALLREWYLQPPMLPASAVQADSFRGFDQNLRRSFGAPLAAPLVRMSDQQVLRQIDSTFIHMFQLDRVMQLQQFPYPTVYCESLEEFFQPIVNAMDISDSARDAELRKLVREACEQAERRPGTGILGYNLTGKGCYLNGWLIASAYQLSPQAALKNPDVLNRILSVAVHEKLGHGFIATFTTFGKVKNELGAYVVDIARQFGIKTAASLKDSLRATQSAYLHFFSQFLEEGWATWIETYFAAHVFQHGKHPRHSLEALANAIEQLPGRLAEQRQLKRALMDTLKLIFLAEQASGQELLAAVKVLYAAADVFENEFGQLLGQPLPYIVGELLFSQIEANNGALCVPYAATIAANVHIDYENIGLTDLRELMFANPRLNPDVRLLMLSKVKQKNKGDLKEFIQLVTDQLSLELPSMLKSIN